MNKTHTKIELSDLSIRGDTTYFCPCKMVHVFGTA